MIGKDLQAIQLSAFPGRDGGDIRAVALGDELGRNSSVLADIRLNIRVCP